MNVLPPEVRHTLRYGERLACEVPPVRTEWRAWVLVTPILATPGKRFPLPLNDAAALRYQVRRIELSDWHLDERWAWDMDLAIQQKPIDDESAEAADDAELIEVLARWFCDPSSLRLSGKAGWPL